MVLRVNGEGRWGKVRTSVAAHGEFRVME